MKIFFANKNMPFIEWKYFFQILLLFGNHTLLRFGLPSTLIRHENGGFRKRSSNRRNMKTPDFHFGVGGK